MRHLLDTRTLDRTTALRILDVAEDMSDTQSREVKKLPTLRGKTVVNLFFEDSTRTRISFEAAAKRLSADVSTSPRRAPASRRAESMKDTAQTLEAIGADAVVVRHPGSGAPQTLATSGWISAGVVNAGDGTHEHPTQALLDAFTIRKRRFGADSRGQDLSGMRVVIVGDVLHSRVARSTSGCSPRSVPKSRWWLHRRWFPRTSRSGRSASCTTSIRRCGGAGRGDDAAHPAGTDERRVFPD